MKKQTVLHFLFVIPLILSAFLVSTQLPKAEAKGGTTCEIYPRSGQVFNRAECDSFVFVSGWAAINKGLINEFQKGALITLSVTGDGYSRIFSPEVVKTLWAKPRKESIEGFLDCPLPYLWVSDYYLPLGSLEPGTYKTVLVVDPRHPLKDGIANVCTWADGSLIVELPALYREKEISTNTFEVTSPNP